MIGLDREAGCYQLEVMTVVGVVWWGESLDSDDRLVKSISARGTVAAGLARYYDET